ncbi:protein of unknown function [Thauera humireducens]|nr:protein of unknown function [Thauera humireducens]
MARGSDDPSCGCSSAETPATGYFLGQRRLFSPFVLRVGARRGLEESETYARQFIVNQGYRSDVQTAMLA